MTDDIAVDLSIVIVNYRGWDRLERCLASLRPLVEGAAPRTEVVVVDNDSGDGLFEAFARAHPFVRFVENDGNRGFGDGCNRGAAEARGEFLLFFNPDAEDPGGGIAAFLAAARGHPECAILAARQIDDRGRPQKVYDAFPSLATVFGAGRALLRRLDSATYPDGHRDRGGFREVDWVSGSVLLVRRAVFESLGGFFDGYFMYSEDVDLCRRARDAGHRIAVADSPPLRHAHGGTSRIDPATAAMTKSEVVVSRHLYASRHLRRWHACAYHVALVLSRFVPLTPAALLALAIPATALRVRAGMFGHLVRYYRGVPRLGWRSRRARPDGASARSTGR